MPDIELQPQSEEPLLLAGVREYWLRKKGARPLPRRKDINPADIKKWLPQVLLVQPLEHDFRYRLVGSRLRQFFPGEPTGKTMREALAPFGEATVQRTIGIYASVLTLGEPLRIKGDGAWYGQDPKYFDAILTPLADERGQVNMIFGAFDFIWDQAYARQKYREIDDQVWHAAQTVLQSLA